MKGLGLRRGRRRVERRRALLDPHPRHQLRCRRGHRRAHGVPVRHELGALLALRGQRRRPHARDGGLFAFFLESSFLALLVFGERRSPGRATSPARRAVLGAWLSGYFIIATNAFMQHPVGHASAPDGHLVLADFGAFLFNPWALAQYAHNMRRPSSPRRSSSPRWAPSTLLQGSHVERRALFLRLGVGRGLVSSVLVAFPTGDAQAKLVARHQPVALAAMEGRFESGDARRST
jgi:cytochrome d ubiquinol oxidase subunit I